MSNKLSVEELRKFAEKFVEEEPERLGTDGWWQVPLLTAAPIDARFDQLPQIAADDHLLPRDLLPTANSVIVFYIPFNKELVKANEDGEHPCREWGVAYVQTNDLIGRLSQALGDFLAEQGYKSGLTPATHNFDDVKLMARWSHKHLAHLVNLGRFGVHHMMITPLGCTGRLGSFVSEVELGEHPLIQTEEACLLKAGQECGKCIEACPVEALSANDFERRRCWDRLNENRRMLDYFSDLPESTHVCGKCAALAPCSFKNPVAALKSGD
ncbi:MAG: epoxyqueuosine reductase [Deltaproteobacteria bacterium]|jgi:epoxyqueuosine reductase QueG|nr:epoxyqueuosine reductase [Deltaproteobacteria bacterium]